MSHLTTFNMCSNLWGAQALLAIDSSLKPNHHNQVEVVLIHDTHDIWKQQGGMMFWLESKTHF